MQQIQVSIANMPVNLILLSNSTLAFVSVANLKALFDMAPAIYGVDAAFYESEFTIGEDLYSYNVT